MKRDKVSLSLGGWVRKYFANIFVCLISFVLFTAVTSAQENSFLTEEEQAWLEENPVVKATNDMAWAPLDYLRAGRPAGFSVDYLKLLAEKIGFTVDFVNGYTWPELMEMVQNREIDIVHAVVQDPAKAEFLEFTNPYLDLQVAVFGHKGVNRISSPEDLQGKSIGVIAGFGVTEQLRHDYPQFEYHEYYLAVDALNDLSNAKIDVFIGIIPTANYAIKANFIEGVEIIGRSSDLQFGQSAAIHLASHKDNIILSQILNKGVALISEEEILSLEQKWRSVNATSNELFLTAEESDWIKKNPIIRATNEMDWAPIDFSSEGKPMGFSVDYLNLIADKLGLSVEYVNGHTWQELMEMMRSGEIDIAQSITQTKNRENFLNFTAPYLDLPKVYVARVGAAPINKLGDLEGRRIGLIEGWSSAEHFKQMFPSMKYVYYPEVKDALYALASGEIDVFSERLPVVNYIISKNFISGLEVIGTELYPEVNGQNYLRMATRKELPVLHGLIEKAMVAITDEEFKRVSEKWRAEFYSQNDIGLSVEEIQWLASHNVIKALIDPNLAPYEFIDEEGKVSGISGAYLEKIAKKLNIQIEWAGNENREEGSSMFANGEAHVLSGVVPTPERAESFIFTDPYMQSTSAIFARNGGQFFVNMDGLSGFKVAQEKGFALTEFIKRDYPNIEVVEVDSSKEALQLVIEGSVDAHIGDIPTVAYQIVNQNLPIIVAGETPYTKDMSYAIHPDLPLLASAMKKALNSLSQEDHSEITNKWLAIKFENNINYDLIIKIVAASAIFLAIVLVWAISLRREIHRRRVIEEQLVIAQRQAIAANEAKSAFLANMSHEIRTPLNAIIGFSEIMSQNLFGKISPPRYAEYLVDIESSGRHLATVINDILDLSKIEAGKWELVEEKFDLDACIQSAIMMIETQAASKQVRLFYSPIDDKGTAELIGDEVAFRRVIINLLSNAVKFTENGGMISCTVSKSEENDAVIKIRDTGVGIPADKLDHVLTPFGQSADNQYMISSGTGTGLGLSIVKELIELHGGEFILESEVGVGTEAIIKMPACKVISLEGTIEEVPMPKSASA